MSDYTLVYFKGLHNPLNVPSTLADFYIGNQEFTIRWYGVLIAIGFLIALLFCTKLCKKSGINLDVFFDEVIWGTIIGILGARAYYVLFSWDYYKDHPGEIWRIHDGGLAIYGGIIAALITVIVVSKVKKAHPLDMFDLAGVGFLMGQGVGRWGNFMNQEAFGTNTNLPWGMTSAKVKEYIITRQYFFQEHGLHVSPNQYVHPTFLYESIWCLLGFVILYIMFSKHRKYRGEIILMYCVWYGVERAVVEGLRTDSLYIGASNVRVSQWISAGIAVAAFIALIVLAVKYKGNPGLKGETVHGKQTGSDIENTDDGKDHPVHEDPAE